MAAVRLREGSEADAEALRGHAREQIAGFTVPRVVHLIDQPLPKSGAGKILKRALRDEYTPASTGAQS